MLLCISPHRDWTFQLILTTLNNGLSVRLEHTVALASSEAQLLALKAKRTAEQREWGTPQSAMRAQLADKDALIASLQQQDSEPPDDADAPVENDTGGV